MELFQLTKLRDGRFYHLNTGITVCVSTQKGVLDLSFPVSLQLNQGNRFNTVVHNPLNPAVEL